MHGFNADKSLEALKNELEEHREELSWWLMRLHHLPVNQSQLSALVGLTLYMDTQQIEKSFQSHANELETYSNVSLYPLALLYGIDDIATSHTDPAVRKMAQMYVNASQEDRVFYESLHQQAVDSEAVIEAITNRLPMSRPLLQGAQLAQIIEHLGEVRSKKESDYMQYAELLTKASNQLTLLQTQYIAQHQTINAHPQTDQDNLIKRNNAVATAHNLYKGQRIMMESLLRIARPLNQTERKIIALRKIQETLIFLYTNQYHQQITYYDNDPILETLNEAMSYLLYNEPSQIGLSDDLAQLTFELLNHAASLTYPTPFSSPSAKP